MSKVSHLKLVTVSCFILLTLTSLYIFSLLSFNLDLPLRHSWITFDFIFVHFIVIHYIANRVESEEEVRQTIRKSGMDENGSS